jgi:hypothetical protein
MGARRYDAKRDANELAIVRRLEAEGFSVQRLTPPAPDLVVGVGRVNVLLEVKVEGEDLTEPQETWHSNWKGQVCIVTSPEQAVGVVSRIASIACPF